MTAASIEQQDEAGEKGGRLYARLERQMKTDIVSQ